MFEIITNMIKYTNGNKSSNMIISKNNLIV